MHFTIALVRIAALLLVQNLCLPGQPAGGVPQPGSSGQPAGGAPPPGGNSGGTQQPSLDDLIADQDARMVTGLPQRLDQDWVPRLQPIVRNCQIAGSARDKDRDILSDAANRFAQADVNTPVLIHLMEFQDEYVLRNCWFTATPKGIQQGKAGQQPMVTYEISNSKRLYGKSSYAILYFHLQRKVGDKTAPVEDVPEGKQTEAELAAQKVANANAEAAAGRFDFSSLEVRYYSIVKAKLSQSLLHLLELLKLATTVATGQAAAKTKTAPVRVSYYGVGIDQGIPKTCDITALPTELIGAKLELRGQKLVIDNEGKAFWDISVGVPATKLTALEYSETTARFDPKAVNKQTIFGLVNLFYPMDLKGQAKERGVLRLLEFLHLRALAGLGVTGRPGDRLFIGGGIGIKQLQIFAGTAFVSSQVTVGTKLETRLRSQFSMGVNIPVGAAVRAITPAKK